jgi:light-independent protochlorophyllide reductase subunit B
VQDFPARYSPQMGFEGANVIFDTWIHPLVMGLEEHLLTMFRDDFEFHDEAGASHHGGHAPKAVEREELSNASGGDISEPKKWAESVVAAPENIIWLSDAERELKKIPFFVRGKARRNTETFALQKGIHEISIDTLYEAKAHYAR